MSTAAQITNICDFVNPNDSEILDSDTSVRWFDNKKVDTTSSYVGLGEGGEAERWDKKEGKNKVRHKAHRTTFEFGGGFQWTVTQSLGSFLLLTTSRPVSTKGLRRVSSARAHDR